MAGKHEFFGPDDDSYNMHTPDDGFAEEDGSGRPGIAIVSSAIMFWAGQRGTEGATVGSAADAFRMPPEAVVEAVTYSGWMLIEGPDDSPMRDLRIELDGE